MGVTTAVCSRDRGVTNLNGPSATRDIRTTKASNIDLRFLKALLFNVLFYQTKGTELCKQLFLVQSDEISMFIRYSESLITIGKLT